MLKTRNIGAYRDLLVLFTKYGRKDFRLSFDPEDILTAETDEGGVEPDVQTRAQAFAAALKKIRSRDGIRRPVWLFLIECLSLQPPFSVWLDRRSSSQSRA